MDPLSAVASIFAVVSLAIQVSNYALKIKTSIEAIASAPAEILRLGELIGSLYLIAKSVQSVLSQLDEKAGNRYDESLSSTIRSSLSACAATTIQINGILDKTKGFHDTETARSRVLTPFWLLCKKSRIEELERRLHQEVSRLHLALTLHSMLVQSRPYDGERHFLPLCCHSNESYQASNLQLRVASLGSADHSSYSALRVGKTLLVRKFIVCYQYKGILGSFTVTKDTKILGNYKKEAVASSEGSHRSTTHRFCIWPAFLSWGLEFHYMKLSRNSPEIGLRPIHVIDRQVEKHLRHLFFDKDLIGLRRVLDSGDITPYSLDRSGQSLLTFAQLYFDENAVVLLATEGCPVGINNVQACTSWAPFHEGTFKLLCSALDLTEFPVDAVFLDGDTSVAALGWYEWFTTQSLPYTSFTLSEWLGSKLYVEARTWAKIVHAILTYNFDSPDLEDHQRQRLRWEKLMIQSIQNGANRQYLDKYEFSAMGLWIKSYHPLDAQQIIDTWLEFLESCGVNLILDIQAEVLLFKAAQNLRTPVQESVRRRRVLFRVRESGRPQVIVSWDKTYARMAEEALVEFNDLGDDEAFLSELRFSKGSKNDWERFWPFAYNAAVNCQGRHQGCFRCSQYQRKAERRQKQRRPMGLEKKGDITELTNTNIRVPGSWAD